MFKLLPLRQASSKAGALYCCCLLSLGACASPEEEGEENPGLSSQDKQMVEDSEAEEEDDEEQGGDSDNDSDSGETSGDTGKDDDSSDQDDENGDDPEDDEPKEDDNNPKDKDSGGDNDNNEGGDAGESAGTCGEGGEKGVLQKITLGSAERYYWVAAPDTEDPMPMVVAFHGDEGDPEKAVRSFWSPLWQKNKEFVLVMTKCPGCTSWYKGDTKANAKYVWDVLEDVSANHNIDVSRVYAIGYSGGSVFLSNHGFEYQNVFAGIQWHCGGGYGYSKPPRDDCKVDGRIVIAEDDFLWDSAKNVEKTLKDNGHSVDFVKAECSGHCCHTNDLAVGAWDWFKKRSKCGGVVAGSCAELTDLPE